MDMLIWAIGIGLIIVVYVVNVRRGNRHGTHYHDGIYHSSHDSDYSTSARHGGDWGGRDMSHDHHGGYDGDSGSDGGGGDSGGGDGGGGDGGGGE